MKVVLSWLREFAPFPDDVDALVDALAEPRAAGRGACSEPAASPAW